MIWLLSAGQSHRRTSGGIAEPPGCTFEAKPIISVMLLTASS
jgi:hypothetical protein